MSEISERLKAKFQERLTGDLESCVIEAMDNLVVYWKPITGRQQKNIQLQGAKSTTEGVCMHVKTRALDDNGEHIFGDVGMPSMMNDFDFGDIVIIFNKMNDEEMSSEYIEKN